MIRNADLQPLNTFGLPGRAAFLIEVEDGDKLPQELASAELRDLPRLVLGGGSNLVLDGDFPGVVLKLALRGRRLIAEEGDARIVEAGAGENWHDFVRWTLQQGWGGLENLSLIPGTVGAAPIQNIGAYGLEMAERFDSLDALDLHGGPPRRFERADCRFGYRDSVFKQQPGRWLVTRVRFRLPRHWQPLARYADVAAELGARGLTQPTPLQVSDAVVAIRQRKLPDPAQIGNAGSFFKNPVVDEAAWRRLAEAHPGLPHYPQPDGSHKLAAGWLIEQAGWKGRDLGPVGCFERQALVLVNRGGATGADVRRLAAAIQADVLRLFGVALEAEPVFV
ncbi:UDP-N-acetylmuramate dehydrogenase [Azoarcus indigens]|uniref:UDP-N-acetylenolpyruvoylglucosamine reductase n=1 Tax=Azoarcus indigens TaxID=29545 RepID=A0A4R6DT20_9RHOO|nr:UDP-N-acetylmuramate dehydrogenase [Azoarcus indigens]TDN47408.1 UDP-N-acetylmuramate dehydrogenase [Azoarcus indigens]